MRIVAFKELCKKKKKRKIYIICTPKLFMPLALSMSLLIFALVLNLAVGNFFENIYASVQNFVSSFVKFLWFKI